ncbi:[NiFe]-hydrogenase II apoprotein, ferredoxin-type subunit [Persephonella hydrogeniphila]|uniref:[NiFe]-hydrogenase II apoprotein, ferredoxin-type subunit n=1 Tax=Persephonella hydrogeniphila TaxID=198703 RepID=A0A285NC59_9AQUI|nr:Ni/Fe hydrogenase [Persephonella hydrogeniphila]SNZ07030.1 [NiFe]-hydrogenase II apoprotein, ferredoxin-type subunit [Persephonella hydrogeniphila]
MKTLLWIQGLTCNGNTQSLLNAENPSFYELFSKIKLLYHPSISYREKIFSVLKKIKEEKVKLDILVVEGAITTDKNFCRIGNLSISEILDTLSKRADFIIAAGNCASYGNIPALYTKNKDIRGLQFKFTEKKGYFSPEFRTRSGYPVINIPGCPMHPAWFTQTVLAILENRKIILDDYNRPKELFMYLPHDGCIRNEYFEWKVESEEFGHKEGCLFYNLGCKGPMTHAPCNKILWNRISSKTRAGSPCLGCTEFNFPLRENYFETKKNIGIPEEVPLGVSKRAYITISGVAKTLKNERLLKKLEETE